MRSESSWEHLFRTILKWFRWKNNLGGLRETAKQTYLAQKYIYLVMFMSHEKQKYSLTLDNFSLSSQQLVPNYFLYPSKSSDVHLREILAQFWPNKHSSVTRRHLAIVETRLKSWKRRTAENYLRSIVMLLTLNQLHFSWSYWLLKFLLLPYTWDSIKDAVLRASTKMGEISAEQCFTYVQELPCRVWSCFGHVIF